MNYKTILRQNDFFLYRCTISIVLLHKKAALFSVAETNENNAAVYFTNSLYTTESLL